MPLMPLWWMWFPSISTSPLSWMKMPFSPLWWMWLPEMVTPLAESTPLAVPGWYLLGACRAPPYRLMVVPTTRDAEQSYHSTAGNDRLLVESPVKWLLATVMLLHWDA